MTERIDIEELAAEYVLGTLPADERSAISVRRRNNNQLDKAILEWEQRLAPLLDVVLPVTPPKALYQKIRSQISSVSDVISLQKHRRELTTRVRPWRIATSAMTALAASLAGFIVWTGDVNPPMQSNYVAVIQESSQTPAFLMTVDTKTHMCAIKSVIAPPQSDKNYELWLVHDSLKQPKSLGVIAMSEISVMPMASDVDPELFMKATFAVSLEPVGGSPTGIPTGPVMYAGKLVQSTL